MPGAGLSLTLWADDLTGAIDSALPFFRLTGQARVWVKPEGILEDVLTPQETTPVLSINTDTRHSAGLELSHRLEWAIRQGRQADYYFKKIDSTCRGLVGQECLYLREALGLDAVIIAPAFPEQGRQLVGGYLLLGGVPIERTEVGRDPMAPVRQSFLPHLLTQHLSTTLTPEHIEKTLARVSLSTVMKGAGPLVARISELLEQGKQLLVVDSATATDLDQLALALDKLSQKWKVLPCGSAGLANAMAKRWFPQEAPKELMEFGSIDAASALPLVHLPKAPMLVVAGSTMPATRRQLHKLSHNPAWQSQHTFMALKPGQLLGLEPIEPLQEKLAHSLAHHELTLISSCPEESSYEDTLALARENFELDNPAEVALRVQETLLKICAPAFDVSHLQLIVCGGHTGQAFCHQLGSVHLNVLQELEPSVALCQDNQGRVFVSKPGNFGDALTLVHVVEALRELSHTT